MRVQSFQIAYFFNGIMNRPDTRWTLINNRLNNLFNGYPTILPYDNAMPLDFPYVQLKSEDGKYSLNMSKMRCDFIINPKLEELDDEVFNKYFVYINNLTEELSNQKFSRIGIVGRYIIENTNPLKLINSKYFTKNLEESTELTLRYNIRKKWNNTQINDVIEISSTNFSLSGKKNTGVLIQRDVNTIPDLIMNMQKKEVDRFILENSHYFTETQIVELVK